MVPEPPDIIFRFEPHALDELIMRRVYPARELKILPDEETKF